MIEQLYDKFKPWSAAGTVYLYSDPHFGDEELAAGLPNRPSADEQVAMINAKVGRKDTLIILGDVGDVEYAKKLRGYKVLIMGNHDRGASVYKEVFDEVYEGPLFVGERLLLSHEPIDLPFALNIHGHDHVGTKRGKNHLNVCSDVIGYTPINMNQLMKSGILANIDSIHRETIDGAIEKKKKRGSKKLSQLRK